MKRITLAILAIVVMSLLAQAQSLESPYHVFQRSGRQHIDLSADWELISLPEQISATSGLEGMKGITVSNPTSVQMAYNMAGLLPDPYRNLNSDLYECLEQQAHYYRKSFPSPEIAQGEAVILSFDGIDYNARVWLNGTALGEHRGMFGGPDIRIDSLLNVDGGLNDLVVEVKSANYKNPGFKGRTNHEAVRTWFFSDCDVTPFFHMGMWNGVRLEILPYYHLERPFLSTSSLESGKVTLAFSAEIFSGKNSRDYALHSDRNNYNLDAKSGVFVSDDITVRLDFLDSGKVSFSKLFSPTLLEGRSWIEESFVLDNPKLWYPNGMGRQDMYRVKATLLVNGFASDSIEFDFGIRKIDNVRSAGPRTCDIWNNWQFVINGVPIFVKGMNWMPLDALSGLGYEDYEWTIRAARDMGVQMFRIWGSGYFETETFYDICDKYGIMVWQDMNMANAETSNWPQQVWEAQVCRNIFRLRNRASLAVWCGGNEFNPYLPTNTASIGIIERNLHEFDPTRPFFRSSPDGGSSHVYPDFDPFHYKDFNVMPYLSESGIHTMSSARNNRKIIVAEDFENLGGMYEKDFATAHPDFVHHFAEYAPSRVPRMLSRASHIGDMANPLYEDIVEAAQVGAGEFYQVMSESVQSNYPVTVGMMPWVWRRSWPVVAAIQLNDYFGQPTAPYYFLKRTYEKTHVLADMPRLIYAPGDHVDVGIKVINAASVPSFSGKVTFTVMTDRYEVVKSEEYPIEVQGGTSVSIGEAAEFDIPDTYHERFLFVMVELHDDQGRLVSRSVYWPRTIKLMEDSEYHESYISGSPQWPTLDKGPWLKPVVAKTKTSLELSNFRRDIDGSINFTVTNNGKNPSPMTQIDVVDGIFFCSDNFFWLSAGESKELKVTVRGNADVHGRLSVLSWNAKTRNIDF